MERSPESLALGMTTTGDPDDPTASSGLPTSLLGALRELMGQVVAISDAPSRGQARAALAAGTLLSWRPSDLRDLRAAKVKLYNVGKTSGPFAAARARSTSAQLAGKTLDGKTISEKVKARLS